MDFSDILSWATDAIGTVASAIATFLNSTLAVLWDAIQSIISTLTSFIAWVWNAISQILSWLGSWWSWLKTNIIDPIISHLKNWLAWWKALLTPLVQWIHQVYEMEMWYYNNILKPALQFIQTLRQFLVVFRLLGFKWAAALDEYLEEAEEKIETAFLAVLQNLNLLSEWINFIVDPFGLFQPNIFVGSILRSVGAIVGAIWETQNVPLGASTLAQAQATNNQFTNSYVEQSSYLNLTQGPQPDDDADVEAVDLQYAQLG